MTGMQPSREEAEREGTFPCGPQCNVAQQGTPTRVLPCALTPTHVGRTKGDLETGESRLAWIFLGVLSGLWWKSGRQESGGEREGEEEREEDEGRCEKIRKRTSPKIVSGSQRRRLASGMGKEFQMYSNVRETSGFQLIKSQTHLLWTG